MFPAFDSIIVTLVVGPPLDAVQYSVHEEILCARSEYFRRAFTDGRWKESETKWIELPEDEPAAIQLYLQYIYYDCIESKFGIKDKHTIYEALASMYVFAEKIQDTSAKNAALTELVSQVNQLPKKIPLVKVVDVIYNGTRENSPARRFLVDLYTRQAFEVYMMKVIECLPREFLGDIVMKFIKQRGTTGCGSVKLNADDYLEGSW